MNYAEDRLIKEYLVKDMVTSNEVGNLLTIREVARLLHVHPNTLRHWSDTGRIKALRITPRGDRRFRPQDVDRFLADIDIDGKEK